MNNLHEQNHKRTSINELLNPVANGPAAGSLDGSYSPAQLAAIPSPPYASSSHGQQRYHSSLAAAGTPFSLRAASWDQSPDGDMASRQDAESSTSCRYASASSHPAPHQSPPHPVYADPYHRSRPVGEPANYGIDVSPWTPASHEHPPYGAHVPSPIYSDERTGLSSPLHHSRRPCLI
ncbi:hypothetical protein PHLGIDRAFT_343871 [Phlebiopsis gigantea 11061_1 CR5-6]|uniref:Uncharacterized protein n=1 Tax=Phlebiopsis gigantea (strain 11061_1 CR5-6) TaxID=745531 RepID=A0A0C3S203_PHLG1|nr:hypothetical protein PHLGIDRAFT_343871 [Phlebiopsis gigantea 11061_1 CR5-6]